MATTIVGSPDKFAPAYNPIWFYVQSARYGEEGFKYVFDLFPSGSAARIARQRLFPRPN